MSVAILPILLCANICILNQFDNHKNPIGFEFDPESDDEANEAISGDEDTPPSDPRDLTRDDFTIPRFPVRHDAAAGPAPDDAPDDVSDDGTPDDTYFDSDDGSDDDDGTKADAISAAETAYLEALEEAESKKHIDNLNRNFDHIVSSDGTSTTYCTKEAAKKATQEAIDGVLDLKSITEPFDHNESDIDDLFDPTVTSDNEDGVNVPVDADGDPIYVTDNSDSECSDSDDDDDSADASASASADASAIDDVPNDTTTDRDFDPAHQAAIEANGTTEQASGVDLTPHQLPDHLEPPAVDLSANAIAARAEADRLTAIADDAALGHDQTLIETTATAAAAAQQAASEAELLADIGRRATFYGHSKTPFNDAVLEGLRAAATPVPEPRVRRSPRLRTSGNINSDRARYTIELKKLLIERDYLESIIAVQLQDEPAAADTPEQVRLVAVNDRIDQLNRWFDANPNPYTFVADDDTRDNDDSDYIPGDKRPNDDDTATNFNLPPRRRPRLVRAPTIDDSDDDDDIPPLDAEAAARAAVAATGAAVAMITDDSDDDDDTPPPPPSRTLDQIRADMLRDVEAQQRAAMDDEDNE